MKNNITKIIVVTLLFISMVLAGGCAKKEHEPEETSPTKVLPTDTAPPPKSVGTEISIVGPSTPFFEPAEITIQVGGRITWTNNDTGSRPHTVTADDNSFDSGNLSKDDVFSRTFEKP